MELLSSITACTPLLPTKAAAALTLRSPASSMLDDQAEKSPDSKLSVKIRSEEAGVGVRVTVGPDVGVRVAVGPGVVVRVAVGAGPDVGVRVAVGTDPVLTQLALPESVKVC